MNRTNNGLQQKIQVIWRIVLYFNMLTFNKMYCGLIGWCFKMPNAPYLNRWGHIKKKDKQTDKQREPAGIF